MMHSLSKKHTISRLSDIDMKKRFGFSYEQSRAVRYSSVNDFYGEERKKKEEQMEKLKEDRARYEQCIEEERCRGEAENRSKESGEQEEQR